MIVELTGVLRNGAEPPAGEPARPYVQNVSWNQGEDGVVDLALIDSARVPVAIPVGGRVVLTVRKYLDSATPLFGREAVLLDAGAGEVRFVVDAADTENAATIAYYFDVWYVDAAGERHQVVPVSRFKVVDAVGQAGEVF